MDYNTIVDITSSIVRQLEPQIDIETSIPPLVKVASVLHFCASGSFQTTVGLASGISQPAFCAILTQVMDALLAVVQQHIRFPRTAQDVHSIKRGFYRIAGIPNVLGALDGTHIALVPPRAQRRTYINRKGFYSINVQAVASWDLTFTYVCAKFPGSTHDSMAMRNSAIPRLMSSQTSRNSWLLGKYAAYHHVLTYFITHTTDHVVMVPTGDAAYPCSTWLLSPVRGAQTPADTAYNRAHAQTRNPVERAFGLLKARFRCLDRSGGALLHRPEKVCRIVILCCLLHNIAVRRGVPLPTDTDIPTDGSSDDEDTAADANAGDRRDAFTVRRRLIADYFT